MATWSRMSSCRIYNDFLFRIIYLYTYSDNNGALVFYNLKLIINRQLINQFFGLGYFPIAYPLQLDKRLKLSFAFKIMLAGWLYSILMASLPLNGVSSYSKTSICLPMETRNNYDKAYLIFILCFSAVDFVLICACYGKMYYSIVSQKTRATNNDMKVAKGTND